MPDDSGKDGNFKILIARSIFPDAAQIFQQQAPLDKIRNDALVVLDTNTLLVPYNVGPSSLAQIGKTYKHLVAANRLVVPGQVAREFARNRAGKLSEVYLQISRKKASRVHMADDVPSNGPEPDRFEPSEER